MSEETTGADSKPVPQTLAPLQKQFTWMRFKERIIRGLLFLCAVISIVTTLGIVCVLLSESVLSFGSSERSQAFFQQISPVEFFTGTKWTPQYAEKHFGVLPLIMGTMLVAGIAAGIGLPIGLLSALYLSEYATPRTRAIVKPMLEILAGIPTVVYGFFALVFVTPYVLKPIFMDVLGFNVDSFNAASAGIVVGIMILPMVCSLSEDALRAVPQSLREAGYALGSTRFDVSARIVLPAASSGIVASFLLAIARAIGETMAVTIAAGQKPSMTLNPFRSIETMTAYIVNVSKGDTPAYSIEYKSLYAVALTLFAITLSMNIISLRVLRKYREVYE